MTALNPAEVTVPSSAVSTVPPNTVSACLSASGKPARPVVWSVGSTTRMPNTGIP